MKEKVTGSFVDDDSRNVVIFGVDNSSSSRIDNSKSNFLVLGKGPTERINGSVGAVQRKVSIGFIYHTKFFD